MNNRAFVFILFLLFAFQSRSQQFFQRSYGGSGSDYGRSIITCTSGGYLVIGSSNSFFEPSTDVYFLRLNENGDYVWGENIGFENKIDWGFDIVESPEGIYYAVGYTNNTVDNSYDGMLISINDDGHVLDIHIFENEGWEFLYNMTTTEDSNLCVAGTKIGLSSHVGWVFKCDYSGNIIWESFISSENGNLKITGLDRSELIWAHHQYVASELRVHNSLNLGELIL